MAQPSQVERVAAVLSGSPRKRLGLPEQMLDLADWTCPAAQASRRPKSGSCLRRPQLCAPCIVFIGEPWLPERGSHMLRA